MRGFGNWDWDEVVLNCCVRKFIYGFDREVYVSCSESASYEFETSVRFGYPCGDPFCCGCSLSAFVIARLVLCSVSNNFGSDIYSCVFRYIYSEFVVCRWIWDFNFDRYLFQNSPWLIFDEGF